MKKTCIVLTLFFLTIISGVSHAADTFDTYYTTSRSGSTITFYGYAWGNLSNYTWTVESQCGYEVGTLTKNLTANYSSYTLIDTYIFTLSDDDSYLITLEIYNQSNLSEKYTEYHEGLDPNGYINEDTGSSSDTTGVIDADHISVGFWTINPATIVIVCIISAFIIALYYFSKKNRKKIYNYGNIEFILED